MSNPQQSQEESKNPANESEQELTAIQVEILEYVRTHGPIDRRSMVRDLDYPRTTLYDNLAKIKKKGLVESYKSDNQGARGRPLVKWKLKRG